MLPVALNSLLYTTIGSYQVWVACDTSQVTLADGLVVKFGTDLVNDMRNYLFGPGGRTGLMVRASDSGSGDPGSILGRVGVFVSLSKRHLLPKSTGNTQE